MTEDELATIEARANAATIGPWRAPPLEDINSPAVVDGPDLEFIAEVYTGGECSVAEVIHGARDRQLFNATFIAAARADVPALVAEVRRLTTELSYAGRPRYSGDASVAVEAIDAAFNRGAEAMREAAVQHFKQRAEDIEHAAARIACIAPTAAVCATLDEARRVADVAAEIRALKVEVPR